MVCTGRRHALDRLMGGLPMKNLIIAIILFVGAVHFQFELNEVVYTPFGNQGIVRVLAKDGEGRKYQIQTYVGMQWYRERDLRHTYEPKR